MTAAVSAASHIGTAYVAAAAEACSRFIGTCWSLSISGDPILPPAMNPSPAGLAPVEGIPMRAQAILHRPLPPCSFVLDSPSSLPPSWTTLHHLAAPPGTSRDARNLRFASFLAPFESRCQEPSVRVLSRSVRVAMPGTSGSRPFSLGSSRDARNLFGSRPFSLRSSRDARNLRLASFLAPLESRCQEPSARVLSRSVRVAILFLAPFESRCQEPSVRVLSRSVRVAMPGTFDAICQLRLPLTAYQTYRELRQFA